MNPGDLGCWMNVDDTDFVSRVSDALCIETTRYPSHLIKIEPTGAVWFSVETLANVIDEAKGKEVDG